MKRRYLFLALLAMMGSLLIGCSPASTADRTAQATVNAYYAALQADDFSSATSFFAPELFQTTSKEAFIQLLEQNQAKYGPVERWELLSWDIKYEKLIPIIGTSGHESNYYQLVYHVDYQSRSMSEVFIFTNPPSKNNGLITNCSTFQSSR